MAWCSGCQRQRAARACLASTAADNEETILSSLHAVPPPFLLLPGKKWVNVVNAVEEISLLLSRGGFRGHRQVHRVQIQCLIQCLSLSQGHLSWVDVC